MAAYEYGVMDGLAEASKSKKSSGEVLQKDGESGKAKDVGDLDMEIEELVSLPKKIDGTADFLGVERVKTQTKIKLGVKTEAGGHYIVVELISKDSKALRLKNAWKVSKEKYDAIKKEELTNTHNRTNNSPAISDDTSSSTNRIYQNEPIVNTSDEKSENNSKVKKKALAEPGEEANSSSSDEKAMKQAVKDEAKADAFIMKYKTITNEETFDELLKQYNAWCIFKKFVICA